MLADREAEVHADLGFKSLQLFGELGSLGHELCLVPSPAVCDLCTLHKICHDQLMSVEAQEQGRLANANVLAAARRSDCYHARCCKFSSDLKDHRLRQLENEELHRFKTQARWLSTWCCM